MQHQKIEKIKAEIEKTKVRISESQSKLRTLERQKTEIENEQIVALVRSEKISDAELTALMKSFRREEPEIVPAEAVLPNKPKKQEEIDNANFDEI
jgi:septal ring factor EnvC (AmiA/AmiB activator)